MWSPMPRPQGQAGEVNPEPTVGSEETAASANDRSVERRLAALTDAIRAWDWRARRDGVGPPAATPPVAATEAPVTAEFVPDRGAEAGQPEAQVHPDVPTSPENSPTAPTAPTTRGRSADRPRHAAPKARRGRFWVVALLFVVEMATIAGRRSTTKGSHGSDGRPASTHRNST